MEKTFTIYKHRNLLKTRIQGPVTAGDSVHFHQSSYRILYVPPLHLNRCIITTTLHPILNSALYHE